MGHTVASGAHYISRAVKGLVTYHYHYTGRPLCTRARSHVSNVEETERGLYPPSSGQNKAINNDDHIKDDWPSKTLYTMGIQLMRYQLQRQFRLLRCNNINRLYSESVGNNFYCQKEYLYLTLRPFSIILSNRCENLRRSSMC